MHQLFVELFIEPDTDELLNEADARRTIRARRAKHRSRMVTRRPAGRRDPARQ